MMAISHRRPLSWNTGLDSSPAHSGFVAEGFPTFDLDASDVSRGAVEVVGKSPSGNTFPMEVIDSDGVFSTNFMPTEIGLSNFHSSACALYSNPAATAQNNVTRIRC